MTQTKDIGFGIKSPTKTCTDKNCPFHGSLKIHGKQFTGKIVSSKMQNSAVVEWVGWRHIPKFERYKKTKTKVSVHNPPCLNAVEGDVVKIQECRPISKTKNFVVIEVLGKEELYALEKESLEEGKHKEQLKSITKKTRETATNEKENSKITPKEDK